MFSMFPPHGTKGTLASSLLWITFSVWSLWPYLTLSISSEGGEDMPGSLNFCVFSRLTGQNLSLLLPVEYERIVKCRP